MEEEKEVFEVRDLREKTKFIIDDIFIDKYASVLGPSVSMVYIDLCRHVDKEQKCFPKQITVAKELFLHEITVNKAITILISFNLIKKRRIGKRCANRYWLIDRKHWKKITEVTKSQTNSRDLVSHKLTPSLTLSHNKSQTKYNRKETQLEGNTYKPLTTKVVSQKYSFKDNLIKMQEDKKRHIQIIALYWMYKNYNLENQQQYSSALKRDLRAANELIGYTNNKLSEVMDYLEENTDMKWTLETIGKFINEDLNNLPAMNKRYGNR